MTDATGLDLQNKSAHISSLNKTPVSIIQEYAAKLSQSPQFNLIHNGIAQNKISFKYSLTFMDYETVGEGSSKKEAKHAAALKLLKKMIEDKPELLETEFKQWDFDNHVVSPYENNIKENAVGKLNDICMNHRIGLPEFYLVREEGQAHAKLFTMCCQVAKMSELATHKTKKQAKHLSAVQMVNRLESFEKSLFPDFKSTPDSMRVLKEVEQIKSASFIKKTIPMDEDLSNYHLLFKKQEWPQSDTVDKLLEEYSRERKLDLRNPIETLQTIVNDCQMQLKEVHLSKILTPKTTDEFYSMSIDNAYPPIYSLGVAPDVYTARFKAASGLITNICILLN